MRYLIIFLFLLSCSENKITYLKCGEKYFAFSKKEMFGKWNNIEAKFEASVDITEHSKQYIKARFITSDDEKKLDPQPTKTIRKIAYFRTYVLDRIKGTISLLDGTDKVLVERKCMQISKSDLPIKKIKQKF